MPSGPPLLRPNAFESCYNLAYVNLPIQRRIPSHCFKDCSRLTELRMRAFDFGCYAFYGCELARIDLRLKYPHHRAVCLSKPC